jgi:hypothetical protein
MIHNPHNIGGPAARSSEDRSGHAGGFVTSEAVVTLIGLIAILSFLTAVAIVTLLALIGWMGLWLLLPLGAAVAASLRSFCGSGLSAYVLLNLAAATTLIGAGFAVLTAPFLIGVGSLLAKILA